MLAAPRRLIPKGLMTDQKITVRAPGEPPVDYVLGETPAVIGRDPSCDIRVPSQYVSRRHIKLEPRAGEIILTDLGGRNPVYVNGSAITGSATVLPGDSIGIADGLSTSKGMSGGGTVVFYRRDGGTGRASHPGTDVYPQRLARQTSVLRHFLDYVH
jgi:hypothetical protein